ncbi:MAG: pilus assembly protein PilM [Clostridiaceae bacterium]|nr:pilus assembly protein PilM [Clostridiaceae bacterium]
MSLIFNVHENHIEIAQVSKLFNKVKIKKVIDFTPGSDIEDSNINLKKLFLKNKITSKNVDVILSIDSIVTRQIEVPEMKDKDLRSYVNNNIGQYFTVNTGDFYFDYKVVEIREEEKKRIFSVLLVAVPKEKINKIKDLLIQNKLNINKIKIYPECLASFYKKYKKQSIAILDVSNEKSSITILDKGKIFIYSTLFLDISDDDSPSELLDNLTYFLNFYSTRNFGNKVDKVFIVGEKSENPELRKILNENIEVNITYEKETNFIEILGSSMEVKAINNKSIDFKETFNEKGQNKEFLPAIIGILLIAVVGIGAYYYTEITLNSNIATPPSLQAEINKYSGLEKTISDLSIEKQGYQKKIEAINEIKNDEFNYVSIIDGIRKGLPKNITVKSMDIQKEKISVVLNINNSTLDVARAVIAINNTKLFETIDISEVKLDDSVKSISLDLKLKNPS